MYMITYHQCSNCSNCSNMSSKQFSYEALENCPPPKYESTMSLNESNDSKKFMSKFRSHKKKKEKEKIKLEEQITSLKSLLDGLHTQKTKMDIENKKIKTDTEIVSVNLLSKQKEIEIISEEILSKQKELDKTKLEISKNIDKINELAQYKDLTLKIVEAKTEMNNIKQFLENTKDEYDINSKLLADNLKLSEEVDLLQKSINKYTKTIKSLETDLKCLNGEHTFMNNFIEENKELYQYLFGDKKEKQDDIFGIYNDTALLYQQKIITTINERIRSLMPTADMCKKIHNIQSCSHHYHNYMRILSFDINAPFLLKLNAEFPSEFQQKFYQLHGKHLNCLDAVVDGQKLGISIWTSIFTDTSKFSDGQKFSSLESFDRDLFDMYQYQYILYQKNMYIESFDIDLNRFKSDKNDILKKIKYHYIIFSISYQVMLKITIMMIIL